MCVMQMEIQNKALKQHLKQASARTCDVASTSFVLSEWPQGLFEH